MNLSNTKQPMSTRFRSPKCCSIFYNFCISHKKKYHIICDFFLYHYYIICSEQTSLGPKILARKDLGEWFYHWEQHFGPRTFLQYNSIVCTSILKYLRPGLLSLHTKQFSWKRKFCLQLHISKKRKQKLRRETFLSSFILLFHFSSSFLLLSHLFTINIRPGSFPWVLGFLSCWYGCW